MSSKVFSSGQMSPGQIAANMNKQFNLFEHFDYRDKKEWMSNNWTLAFWFILAYLCAIFGGQVIMRSRKPLQLRSALTLWNIGLALFSILATVRTLPELISILTQQNGFHHSVCSPW